jgi:hypothetical protein
LSLDCTSSEAFGELYGVEHLQNGGRTETDSFSSLDDLVASEPVSPTRHQT